MNTRARYALIALATVLAFNVGAKAAPASDDDEVSLVNLDSKPQSFGARMAKARAAKHKGAKSPKARKGRKARSAKVPKAPHAPKAPAIGDGF